MILIVSRSKKSATNVADMFFYMGVLAKGATVSESFSEISAIYRSLIILSPDTFPDINDYVKRIKEYNSSIPIFAVGAVYNDSSNLFAHVFPESAYAASIMTKILEYTYDKDLPQPGDSKLAGIDISCDLSIPRYFHTPFHITKTEATILKYLIRTYPNPTSAQEILK